ncbi:host-nuclease inhibitor protein Gam [Candidatus Parcubacteria bacterium]|nr:MAG: host-nuclease inhibitor protein Gam [Candidatus Parcubacteria bacterium]
MARKKSGVKRPAIPAPKDLHEAARYIAEIAKSQRALDRINAKLNDRVATLKERAAQEARVHEERIAALRDGIFAFAESHRKELTENGKKKTITLPTGSFSWRLTPPAVSVRGAQKVIALLKGAGLSRFIRVKETLNKEAILHDPKSVAGIQGISIVQKEEFVIKPAEADIELVTEIKKKKITPPA